MSSSPSPEFLPFQAMVLFLFFTVVRPPKDEFGSLLWFPPSALLTVLEPFVGTNGFLPWFSLLRPGPTLIPFPLGPFILLSHWMVYYPSFPPCPSSFRDGHLRKRTPGFPPIRFSTLVSPLLAVAKWSFPHSFTFFFCSLFFFFPRSVEGKSLCPLWSLYVPPPPDPPSPTTPISQVLFFFRYSLGPPHFLPSLLSIVCI